MSFSERKSFCIESLLSRESEDSGGGAPGHTAVGIRARLAAVGSGTELPYPEVSSPPQSPPMSPHSSPNTSPHSASTSPAAMSTSMLGRGPLLNHGAPLIPQHLYQYPGIGGVPPGLLPHHFPHASQIFDAHTLSALKSGAPALGPGALDWFARAGLMYPRLPPELAGEQYHYLIYLVLVIPLIKLPTKTTSMSSNTTINKITTITICMSCLYNLYRISILI